MANYYQLGVNMCINSVLSSLPMFMMSLFRSIFFGKMIARRNKIQMSQMDYLVPTKGTKVVQVYRTWKSKIKLRKRQCARRKTNHILRGHMDKESDIESQYLSLYDIACGRNVAIAKVFMSTPLNLHQLYPLTSTQFLLIIISCIRIWVVPIAAS